MSNIVEIKNLEKSFKNVTAVDGISLNIKEKEIFGLLGPNGAGKSTTINILCGLLRMDKGDVKCFGKELNKKLREIKKDIGVVPQNIAVYEDLKARENVEFFASLYGLKGKELKEKSMEALEFVGLTEKSEEMPKNFSGGMKRRLNIACAIAHKPKLIIMDEPTVGIDPQSRNHILESVKKLNSMGSTIIYTTHYMEEVEAICTRIGIIDHGKLIASGTYEELQNLVSDRKTIVIESDIGIDANEAEMKKIKGITKIFSDENVISIETNKESDCIGDITAFCRENDIPIRSINMGNISLETVFLSLTGRSLRD
ncbi:MAG: ABC transporter ATP-binding protein [Clostridia bacterium]|nr:ABC transporter ATP-binding protein [Clostridia bacterium]